MRHPEIIFGAYAGITGAIAVLLMLFDRDKPWSKRIGNAVLALLIGWLVPPVVVIVLLVSTPQNGTWDGDHVLRLRAKDTSGAGLLIFPGLAMIAFGGYLTVYALDAWIRNRVLTDPWMIPAGVALVIAAGFLIRHGIRRKRVPADAILLDFDSRVLRRVEGRRALARCAFDSIGELRVTKVERTPPERTNRPNNIKIPEWQVHAAGIPGVLLFTGGAPESAEKTMKLVQNGMQETLQGRRPRRVPLFGIGWPPGRRPGRLPLF